VGPAELIRELRGVRRLMLRHPSAYIQRAFALFLSLGHYYAQLRRQSMALRERAQVLEDALPRHLPEVNAVPISGGSSCWVTGPDWLDAYELSQRAEAGGVLIEPGNVFFSSERLGRNCFRLGYASIATDKIEPGIRKLAEILRDLQPADAAAHER
jgi:GntR family transcriptional regulator/MocR family aminotransferase